MRGTAETDTLVVNGADATVTISGQARAIGSGAIPAVLVVRGFEALDDIRLHAGDHAILTVGRDGVPGELRVRDDDGRDVIHADGDQSTLTVGAEHAPGRIVVRNDRGQPAIRLDGENEKLMVEGGDLIVRDGLGRDVLVMDSSNGELSVGQRDNRGLLRIRDGKGNPAFLLDAGNATLTCGTSTDLPGRIVVRDAKGATSIDIDGATSDIKLMGADLAEDFVASTPVQAGAVVVATGPDEVVPADSPLDHRVVGVVSGAGEFRPALRLGSRPDASRVPIAIVGRVYCQVDASYGAIAVGDLLTTSATKGHAMRIENPSYANGAILGKALAPLASGTGQIPVLLTLR